MSEADTPNNQPLPEPTPSMDDSAADLPEVTEMSEEPRVVNLSNLPTFLDVVQQSRQEEATEPESSLTESSTTLEVDIPATEIAVVSEQRTKDADWFALTQKMRQRNRRLLDQVTQLKAALREKHEELHSEQMRSRAREVLMTQQVEELKADQERLTRLFQALEASHQAAQRQQILIETLSEQLQSSQERIAQLERECALTQQRYNEQSHQLLQAANTCRELRTRLHRQQQQTLQFKTALEKSLEMTPPSTMAAQQQSHLRNTTPTPFPKTQPIQPWSAELEIHEDTTTDPLWNRPLQVEPLLKVYSSPTEPLEISSIERIEQPSTIDTSISTDEAIVASPESTDTELDSEQQLLDEITLLAEASGLLEVQSDLTDAQPHLKLVPETIPEESDNPVLFLSAAKESLLPEESRELAAEAETLDEEFEEDSAQSEPEQEEQNEVRLPQSNWPSPTLYPLRPPKKRKSLAAIDLPSFPRYRPIEST
jgi:hypothetical protein